MAAPLVAAAALIVRQYFEEGFYPSGARVQGDGFSPSGALVKARSPPYLSQHPFPMLSFLICCCC